MSWLELHDPPETLHSGGSSRYRVNADELYVDPVVREAVFACWAACLKNQGITKYRLVPIPRGGVAWAEGFGRYTGEPYRSEQLVIVDDVLTTGGSIAETRKMLGLPDIPALVVVNRGSFQLAANLGVCAWMTLQLPLEGVPE